MGTPLTAEDMQAYCHHRPAVATHVVAAAAADAAMGTTCAAAAPAYQGAAVTRK